jgi:hypothetical protein
MSRRQELHGSLGTAERLTKHVTLSLSKGACLEKLISCTLALASVFDKLSLRQAQTDKGYITLSLSKGTFILF